jgi:4-hydroxythreonine-4-phosphate dehydrogenase
VPPETDKPTVAITMGDPGGVGPEIVVRALQEERVWEVCHPLVVGSRAVLEAAVEQFGGKRMQAVDDPAKAREPGDNVPLWHIGPVPPPGLVRGQPTPQSGQAAFRAIQEAARLAIDKKVAALATAPVSKEAIESGGTPFSGHTDMLAKMTGGEAVMFLECGPLRVAHVTAHVGLRRVCDLVTKPRVEYVIRVTLAALRDLGVNKPRVAVAGLNPHAGEHGLFGTEEAQIIAPVIEALRAEGLGVEGPVSPDIIFAFMRAGRYDAVVAMYHDQGHIPIKTIAFHLGPERHLAGVNVTLGLSVVRTSVDHGTAFDIAWQGKADPQSMIEAIFLASRLALARQQKGLKPGPASASA